VEPLIDLKSAKEYEMLKKLILKAEKLLK